MMDKKEQEFLNRLRETFRAEAEEHLRTISTGLIELEKSTGSEESAQLVEMIFREAHSLKGAARSVNLKEIESLCQPFENTLASLKREEITQSAQLFDLFHQVVDRLAELVSTMDSEPTPSERGGQRELIRKLTKSTHSVPIPSDGPDMNRSAPENERANQVAQAAQSAITPAVTKQQEILSAPTIQEISGCTTTKNADGCS